MMKFLSQFTQSKATPMLDTVEEILEYLSQYGEIRVVFNFYPAMSGKQRWYAIFECRGAHGAKLEVWTEINKHDSLSSAVKELLKRCQEVGVGR